MVKTKTPPLGWNSWNTFGADIDENLIRETADRMVENGYKSVGYEYVIIDDCWSLHERDKNGRLVPDPKKFPNGMKAVADYVHEKGLKFGMYSCAGPLTCAGYPGSFEHEYIDAATFAAWGVDYLKYDYCFHPVTCPAHIVYKRMGLALANCGRDILFSPCSWGADQTEIWAKTVGAGMWRSTEDIVDNFQSVRRLAMAQYNKHIYAGQGCFNDMDMLIVGMQGNGLVANAETGTCNMEEYKTHFSFWALLNSPLIMGCDIRNVAEEYRLLLQNKEVLAINQDPAQNQAFEIFLPLSGEGYNVQKENCTWAKLLSNGDIAIGMFNFSDHDGNNYISGEVLGLPESTGKTLALHDVWSGEDAVMTNGIYYTALKAHHCRLFRARIMDKP